LKPTGGDYTVQQVAACVDSSSVAVRLARYLNLSRILVIISLVMLMLVLFVPSFWSVDNHRKETMKLLLVGCMLSILAHASFEGLVIGFPRSKEIVAVWPVAIILSILLWAQVFEIALHGLWRRSGSQGY
jgi:hypothetical protein